MMVVIGVGMVGIATLLMIITIITIAMIPQKVIRHGGM